MDEDTTTALLKNAVKTIAVQCCRTDLQEGASDEDKCRRYIGAASNCVGGRPPIPYTYSGAVERCAALSTEKMPLALCDIACGGQGCGYDDSPVFSSKLC